ncbi:MAG: HEAT repeat domain-containing protein, partial [Planctomycetota bacterium]|nr:HEAT repeat domain-containing protein [Planctomycetota bacterium]
EGEQSRRPPEIRLAAATALARLSYQGAGPYLRLALEFRTDPDPAIRAQVAAMLGYVPSERGEVLLTDLLEDPSGAVRLAAAGSVLRLSAGGLGGASVEAAAMVGGP